MRARRATDAPGAGGPSGRRGTDETGLTVGGEYQRDSDSSDRRDTDGTR